MWNDFRYGGRVMRKNPGFTAAAAVTLAVGIGLNATLFSILNFLVLKPISVANAAQLVWLGGATTGPTPPRDRFTLGDIEDFGKAGGAIADVLAFAEARVALRAGTQSMRASGQIVTPNYFGMLGADAAEGRLFSTVDESVAGERPAVVSHTLSRRLFASPADAVNQTLVINGDSFRIVGVAAAGFTGPDVLSPADLWVPMEAAGLVAGVRSPHSRTMWWLRGMARLAPGATLPQAQSAVDGIAGSIRDTYPDSHRDFAVRLVPARGVGPHDREQLGVLAVLPVVPFMILLIACANVAGLVLARGVGRAREIAVRRALGATTGQIIRQLLAESVLISLLGGAGALLLLLWSPELLIRFVDAPLAGDMSPDGRVVLFTIALSLLTAVLFGLIPAIRAARPTGTAALRSGPTTGAARPAARLQRALVVGQLALSLVLISASAMFLQSLLAASRADVGFETAGRVTLSVDLKMQRYSRERAASFLRSLREGAAAVPGIQSVSYASYVPLGGRVEFTPVYPADAVVDLQERRPTAGINAVGPGFFDTIRLPILRGRALDTRDIGPGSESVVVNETFARAFFSDSEAVGRRFRLGSPTGPAKEIVGVARDAVIDEFGEDPRPFVYVAHDGQAGEVSVIAWSSVDGASTLRALDRLVRGIDPAVAVFETRTMDQHLRERMDGERGLSRILALAGSLALALAAFGLYAVIAYTVSRQTREIGVRMALGARAQDVMRLFVADGGRVIAWGVACGVPLAIGVGLLLSSELFGVHPADLRALTASTAVLGVAALVASYLPARRAMRVDPMVALRSE